MSQKNNHPHSKKKCDKSPIVVKVCGRCGGFIGSPYSVSCVECKKSGETKPTSTTTLPKGEYKTVNIPPQKQEDEMEKVMKQVAEDIRTGKDNCKACGAVPGTEHKKNCKWLKEQREQKQESGGWEEKKCIFIKQICTCGTPCPIHKDKALQEAERRGMKKVADKITEMMFSHLDDFGTFDFEGFGKCVDNYMQDIKKLLKK